MGDTANRSSAWSHDGDSDFDPYTQFPPASPSWAHRSDPFAPEMQPMLPVSEPSTISSKQSTGSNTPLLSSTTEAGQSTVRLLSPGASMDTSDVSSSSSSGSAQAAITSPTDPGPSSAPLWEQARRSISAGSFVSSPLNPATPHAPFSHSPFSPSSPSHSSFRVTRIASEETRALSAYFGKASPSPTTGRGSMILYRLADPLDDSILTPPAFYPGNRASVISTDSALSLSSDSKYPSGMMTPTERGIIAYSYDPEADGLGDDDEDDPLHDPKLRIRHKSQSIPWRGIGNVAMLVLLIAGLLLIFVLLPALDVFNGNELSVLIAGNKRINATGQAF